METVSFAYPATSLRVMPARLPVLADLEAGAKRRGTVTADVGPAGARRHRGCHAGHPGRLRRSAGFRPCRSLPGACGRRCAWGDRTRAALERDAARAHGLRIKEAPAGLAQRCNQRYTVTQGGK